MMLQNFFLVSLSIPVEVQICTELHVQTSRGVVQKTKLDVSVLHSKIVAVRMTNSSKRQNGGGGGTRTRQPSY
jgi:hypothetical protein